MPNSLHYECGGCLASTGTLCTLRGGLHGKPRSAGTLFGVVVVIRADGSSAETQRDELVRCGGIYTRTGDVSSRNVKNYVIEIALSPTGYRLIPSPRGAGSERLRLAGIPRPRPPPPARERLRLAGTPCCTTFLPSITNQYDAHNLAPNGRGLDSSTNQLNVSTFRKTH